VKVRERDRERELLVKERKTDSDHRVSEWSERERVCVRSEIL